MGTTKARSTVLLRDDVGKRDWVDFVKGAAIILIVAYHVALFLTSIGMDAAGIGRARLVLDLFPMPAFFLISGMFQTRVGSWSFADLWRRRLRQYLYLYVLWSVIRFVFYLIAPNVRSDGAGDSAQDPLALLLILVWPISSYWFIYALFLFTLVVWLFRKAPPAVLLIVSGILSTLSASGLLDTDNSGFNRMLEYLFFFVVGAYFHKRVYGAVERMRPWKAAAVCVAFAIAIAATFVVPGLLRVPGYELIAQILVVAAGFALASYLVRLAPLKWVSYVGQRTLNIYLVHIFIISLLVALVSLIPGIDRPLPDRGLSAIFLLTAVVVALSILLTRYLTRVSWLFVYPFRPRTARAVPADEAPPSSRPKTDGDEGITR
ncbi:acyltransferase family protein [Microbacterium sp. A1-JK]|uniref:acyltransferase family protein n=1 Tax=Microbacterium sp. A1-JK TaxID=3177516 RepID=UPI00388A9989